MVESEVAFCSSTLRMISARPFFGLAFEHYIETFPKA